MKHVYIIGTLTRKEAIKRAALYYLNAGNSVMMISERPYMTKESLIMDRFQKIDDADLVVAVPHSYGEYDEETLYEIAYAKWINKRVVKWKEDMQCLN